MSTDPFSLENQKGVPLTTFDPKLLNELQYVLTDILSGDPTALDAQAMKGLNIDQIKAAIDFILSDPDLTEDQKGELLSNSWRINYRDRPPTPEEFLTEKYLGPVAPTIYPRVKKAFVEYLDPTKPYRTCVLYPHIGWGKEVSSLSYIYTPTGPTYAKDIQVGDEVCTPNGGTARVTSKQEYPNDKMYRLTFSDGRTVLAGGPHYWKAATSYNRIVWNKELQKYVKTKSEPNWKIITTEEIIKSIKANPKDRWFIPCTQPVQHKKRIHIIPPYTLGVLLGAGHFGTTITIVGDDPEIHSRVESELYPGMHIAVSKPASCKYCSTFTYSERPDNPYKKALEDLGLRETRSESKFIPDEYLYDSIENRVALLQGLLDTGGSAHKKAGMAVFYTVSEKLRDGVLELVRGLGGFASYSIQTKKKRTYANFDQYVISISFPQNTFPIFSLKRKQEWIDRGFDTKRHRSKTQYLYITTIEETDDIGGVCISIDDEEKLFLTTGYTVTHNSYLAVLVNMYVGVHLSMMRSPWKFFGQSQPLDCQVLTPQGYVNMGSINVGDIVSTPEGGTAEVIEIHPQGVIPTYEIELEDGRKTRCSAEHLWKVSYRKKENGEKIWEIVTTQFMIDHPEFEFDIPEVSFTPIPPLTN